MSGNRPAGLGRGGRGAALMQLLNQQVRAPGDSSQVQAAATGASQQSPATGLGAGATGPQQPGMMPGMLDMIHSIIVSRTILRFCCICVLNYLLYFPVFLCVYFVILYSVFMFL